jgi:4-hydroxy-3-methylbut-2-enyl diphosphate reductase
MPIRRIGEHMILKIKKAAGIGFCMGVRRAIDILERVAAERGGVETLGAVVHNQQVLRRLASNGVELVQTVAEIQGDVVVISSHGVSPQVEEEIRARQIDIIDTTCPFVKRAQIAARRLAKSGFYIIVYGDVDHPEVKGIIGWAEDKGVATLDAGVVSRLRNLPRRLGVLSQTTQIPASFANFVKGLVESTSFKDSELRVVDTICHDIRQRQAAALKLAKESDLVLVVGGHTSANSRHLVELCSTVTKTHLVETADEIEPGWLKEQHHIGVTSGASTDEETINEVLTRLKDLS